MLKSCWNLIFHARWAGRGEAALTVSARAGRQDHSTHEQYYGEVLQRDLRDVPVDRLIEVQVLSTKRAQRRACAGIWGRDGLHGRRGWCGGV